MDFEWRVDSGGDFEWRVDSDGAIEIDNIYENSTMWLDRETLKEMWQAVMEFEQGVKSES